MICAVLVSLMTKLSLTLLCSSNWMFNNLPSPISMNRDALRPLVSPEVKALDQIPEFFATTFVASVGSGSWVESKIILLIPTENFAKFTNFKCPFDSACHIASPNSFWVFVIGIAM